MSLLDQTLKLVEEKERERFAKAEQRMIDLLRFRAPIQTGDTVARTDSTQGRLTGFSLWSVEMVSRTKQARYQDEGTGIYGPLGTPIVPKKPGGWLHWIDYFTGEEHFAKSVRGSYKNKGWFSKTVIRWADLLGLSG